MLDREQVRLRLARERAHLTRTLAAALPAYSDHEHARVAEILSHSIDGDGVPMQPPLCKFGPGGDFVTEYTPRVVNTVDEFAAEVKETNVQRYLRTNVVGGA